MTMRGKCADDLRIVDDKTNKPNPLAVDRDTPPTDTHIAAVRKLMQDGMSFADALQTVTNLATEGW